jgi:hypothetical protein
LKGAQGRATLAGEKTPVFGMIGRNGQISIIMLADAKQTILKQIIE